MWWHSIDHELVKGEPVPKIANDLCKSLKQVLMVAAATSKAVSHVRSLWLLLTVSRLLRLPFRALLGIAI